MMDLQAAHDPASEKKKNNGKVCISVSILPYR